MAAPLLLVHDDLATIALVRRTLVRAGHTVELATSTADALASASTLRPSLILLAPGVEAGRGPALLQDLATRADTADLPVLLLGRAVEGFQGPVLPAPFRAETVLKAVEQALAAAPPPSPVAEAPLTLAPAETMELDWSLVEPEMPPLSELTREHAVPLPSFGDAPAARPSLEGTAAPEPFDAGPLLEPDPESESMPLLEDEPILEAAEEPQGPPLAETPDEDLVTGEFTFESAPPGGGELAREPLDDLGGESLSLEPPQDVPGDEAPVLEADAGMEAFTEDLDAGSGMSEDTAPVLAVAAGAWAAATEDRLSPRGHDASHASALLEDIASEARAREDEARNARDQAVEEQRRRMAAEAEAESRSREARESSAAAMAARIDAEEARAQADLARAAAAEAEAAREALARELEGRRRAEEEERRLRQDAEARAATEAAEARRLEAEARRLEVEAEAARQRAEEALAAAQASGAAEAEVLATALREEATRRAEELEVQVQLREQAELRAAEEAAARGRAEADVLRASEQAQALEREASELAERLAGEERAAAEARRQAERTLISEREATDELRRELAHARSESRRVSEELETVLARAGDAELRLQSLESAHQEAQAQAHARHGEVLQARQEAESVRREMEARIAAEEARQIRAAQAEAEAEAAEAARRERERARWTVADAGRVTLEDLATLLFRLEEGRATARLELRAADALRVLWLEEGVVAAAASSVSTESLLDHALRDGLVDAAGERELRLLRLSDEQLLQALVQRRWVTEAELVSFLQRVTEARALEAFSEPVSFYRLNADTPPPEGRRAAVRSLSALAAEGVRRGLLPEDVERLVPSFRAVPRSLRPVDPVALGLQDRERRLLDAIDGQRTVQALLLASGVAREPGRRAVAVAVALGWLAMQAPNEAEAEAETAELAVARLEARWSQVEDADYFTVLGLPRSAGSDEVARAFARLSAEYDPLRWAGHPDPRVQARAERMQSLLSEAAAALADDSLRSAYARSLGE